MGAPNIKFYELPQGYSQDGDLDVRQVNGDELLPCTDKSPLLSAAVELSGIVPVEAAPLVPVDINVGRVSPAFSLVYDGENWTPQGVDLDELVIGPEGFFEARVLRADDSVIAPTGYILNTDEVSGLPTSISFVEGTNGTGSKISAFKQPSNLSTNTTWALSHDMVYDGDNEAFNRCVVTYNGGDHAVQPSGTEQGYVVLPAGVTSATATFWYRSDVTRYFCGEQGNWVAGQTQEDGGTYGGHNNMGPDVFVGKIDYPGDGAVLTNGSYSDPGMQPAYREPGTYQVNLRDGMIRFPDEVDTTVTVDDEPMKVRANYAHLVGIRNVTQQVLTPISGSNGKRFKASAESVFPGSHGKRWIGRSDEYTPLKLYVKVGNNQPVQTPTPQSVVPYEIMTIKTAP